MTAVSVGDGNTCAVHNGAIKCFGLAGVIIDPATSGLVTCNEGNLSCALAPVTVPGMGSGVTALSTRNSGHACAIQSGTTKCWGGDTFGQLGTGAVGLPLQFTPLAVSGLSGTITRVTAGSGFSCAFANSGVVSCWGANETGQLGSNKPHPWPAPTEVANGLLPIPPGPPTVTGVTRGNASVTVTFTAPSDPGTSAISSYRTSCSSTNGGTTWGNPVLVGNSNLGNPDKNWIVCDNTTTSPYYGNCYTQWDDNGDGNRLYMSTSTDGGLDRKSTRLNSSHRT